MVNKHGGPGESSVHKPSGQGGPNTQKPIGETAKFMKSLLPVNIPESFTPKPLLRSVASDEEIRRGVIAFRDFMLQLCDLLVAEGHMYCPPSKNPKSPSGYPFLEIVKSLLINIGYRGQLSDGKDSLAIAEISSLASVVDVTGKYKTQKINANKMAEGLRFLSACGLVFKGIDAEARGDGVKNARFLAVSYPNDPYLPIGLKAMSIGHIDYGLKRRGNDDVFSRCDYRVIIEENADAFEALKDFLQPLQEKVREFLLEMHRRHIDMGLTCGVRNGTQFAYFNKKKIIYSIDASVIDSYLLYIRASQTDKYPEAIKSFSKPLQEAIARGYGCDRKLRGEPCQRSCRGFRFTLDDSFLNIGNEINKWLELELSYK